MSLTIPTNTASAEAARMPIREIAAYLQTHLGQRATAYLSGVSDAKMVSHWVAGRNVPRGGSQLRMREAYQAARLLVDACDDETVRAWFSCSNDRLEDRAPAYVLRAASTWEDLRTVLPAARAFVGRA